jgi:glyoxylase I family protein
MKRLNPINITRIDHVVIRVNNLERMIAWYCDVLGCRLERGPGEGRLAQLRAGDSLIDLVAADDLANEREGDARDAAVSNMDHVCLQVEPWNTDIVETHLRQQGVEFGAVAERYGATGMGPSIYLDDPEGNTVELKGVGRQDADL